MPKNSPNLLIVPLALAAALIVALGRPAAAQQFSADLVNTDDGGAAGKSQKIYVADGKVRMEGGGIKGGALLADGAAKTAIMLIPEKKIYVDMARMAGMVQIFMPLNPNDPCPQWQEMAKSAGRNNPGAGDDGAWTCKRIGPDTVNGRSAIKYEAVSPKGEQNNGWVDPKLKFLIKSQNAQGRGMELRNIQEGPQQASLFEIPAGYQKVDMGQMMKQMMPQGGKPPAG
jgi:hypothetical protein